MNKSIVIVFSCVISLLIGCSQLPTIEPSNDIVWLNQGWTAQERQKFHHISQGTMTLPLPYEWFAALEQPGFQMFGEKGLLIENGYLSRLGFITGEVTPYNQAGLPVGFSVDYHVINPQISKKPFNAIGLTCAACHTGQMRVKSKDGSKITSVRYDGGPAMTNLSGLINVIAMSLIETYIDESKFERFSNRVLGVANAKENQKQLKKALRHTLSNQVHSILKPAEIKSTGSHEKNIDDLEDHSFRDYVRIIKNILKNRSSETQEGFTRLDALNRIGNAVFATDTGNYENIATITAPVSYPYIWNTSWFLWVQYDASIMGPMIRNAGEAMGVAAYVQFDNKNDKRFYSSVKLDNLHWMETLLGGSIPPASVKKFGGLQAPQWKESVFGKIDIQKHAKGGKLYAELCQSCHLPPMDSDDFWSQTYWTKPDSQNRSYLDLPIVDINYINTDPEQAWILMKRKVNTEGVGLNTKIYAEKVEWNKDEPVYLGAQSGNCKPTMITSGKSESFALSLGAAVQEVNDYWYTAHNISKDKQARMNGYRKNCLRAPFAYKARPLNGIWATAPFLHNGSVPDLYSLLSPVAERPKKFYLGSLDFDTERMGYDTSFKEGYFELNTQVKGNANTGHEFSDTPNKGVIGRELSEEERFQLIEYLKDIRVVQ